MSGLPIAILWVVALASVVLLVAAGYVWAAARMRVRLDASRQETAALQGKVAATGGDPFGELKVLSEQLQRIRQRLERLGARSGLPADTELADCKTIPPPEPAALPVSGRPPATAELEADLELVRREAYAKTRRIEELEVEKQRLAERVVGLEEDLQRRASAPVPKRQAFFPVTTVEGPATGDGLASLIDTLQQEADALRVELAERDEHVQLLEREDTTGIVHELERIRRELQTRTEELTAAQDQISLAEKGVAQARAMALAADEQKEAMATRSLEVSAELRGAQEKVRDLERQLASRVSLARPSEQEAGTAPPSWPELTTTPGRPSSRAAGVPPVPKAMPSWPPSAQADAQAAAPRSAAPVAYSPSAPGHSGQYFPMPPAESQATLSASPADPSQAMRSTLFGAPTAPSITPPSGQHPAARPSSTGSTGKPSHAPPSGAYPRPGSVGSASSAGSAGSASSTGSATSATSAISPSQSGKPSHAPPSGAYPRPGSVGSTGSAGSATSAISPSQSGKPSHAPPSGAYPRPGSAGSTTSPGPAGKPSHAPPSGAYPRPGSVGSAGSAGSAGSTSSPGQSGKPSHAPPSGAYPRPGSVGSATSPGQSGKPSLPPVLTPSSGQHPAVRPTLLGPPGTPLLTPPSGQHPAVQPGRPSPGSPASATAARRPDPFDVNTLPSAPPDLFDEHNRPTANHPALPSGRVGLMDEHNRPTATHPSLSSARRQGTKEGKAVPPRGSAVLASGVSPSREALPGEVEEPAKDTESGRSARPRRPTGSIFPEPNSRGGSESK